MENPLILLNQMLAGASQRQIADQMGVSPQYLHDVLKGRRAPGKAILDALGLERKVIYERKRGKK